MLARQDMRDIHHATAYHNKGDGSSAQGVNMKIVNCTIKATYPTNCVAFI
jgi:hypothetical protein